MGRAGRAAHPWRAWPWRSSPLATAVRPSTCMEHEQCQTSRRGSRGGARHKRRQTHIPVPPPGIVASRFALCSRPNVFIHVLGVTVACFWLAAPMKPDSTAMLRWKNRPPVTLKRSTGPPRASDMVLRFDERREVPLKTVRG